MEPKTLRRYELWSAERSERPRDGGAALEIAVAPAPKRRPSNLDELQTMLLLYDYGVPVDIALHASCKTVDGKTFQCETKKISSESIDLGYSGAARRTDDLLPGSALNITMDKVGEVSGTVSAHSETGFKLAVDIESRPRLGERLAPLAIERGLNPKASIAGGEDVQRIELKHKDCEFTGPDGRKKIGRIVNLSQLDVLVRSAVMPQARSIIVFRGAHKYAAEVTSTFGIGFLAKFSWRIPDREFSTDMRFCDD